jgi:hypothetical protein
MLPALVKRENNGCHRYGDTRFFYALFFVVLLMLDNPAWGARLITAPELARAGAPGLALALLDQQQPDYREKPDEWMSWQRIRIRVLGETAQWQRLKEELTELPEALPEEFRDWLLTRRVEALLAMGDAQEARRQLLSLIWGYAVTEAQLREWRLMVIRSYLQEGGKSDAFAATLRFRHDYGDDDGSAAILRARVFLGSGHPAEAETILAEFKENPQARPLSLLADLRQGRDPRGIIKQLKNELKQEAGDNQTRQLLWAVYAEAALEGKDQAGRVMALEQLMMNLRSHPLPGDLFDFKADELWQAYFDYATRVGNREQLLFGDNKGWFESADAAGRKYPVKRHSFYALLTQRATTAELKNEAHQRLGATLLEKEGGLEILRQLYLHSGQAGMTLLPSEVRYQLADQAIAEGELELASKLLEDLVEAPQGNDLFHWQLRRAKVFILAGEFQKGVDVIQRLVEDSTTLEQKQIDRLVQLMFDLQTVGEDESAYSLLRQLYLRTDDLKTQRELLYWMADSRMAQENYLDAGRLYLQSAIAAGIQSMDPWAQTARYQAARALAKGGLIADARHLYRQLLKVTEDPARRAVLARDLEKLHLLGKPNVPSRKQ